jgi:hypothetical protein
MNGRVAPGECGKLWRLFNSDSNLRLSDDASAMDATIGG